MKVLLLLCAAACTVHATIIAEASCSVTHVPTGTTLASESYNSLPSSMCHVESPAIRVALTQFGQDERLWAGGSYFGVEASAGLLLAFEGPPNLECGEYGERCYEWTGHARYHERRLTGVLITGGRGPGRLAGQGGDQGGSDLNGSAVRPPFSVTARLTNEPTLVFTYGRPFNLGFELLSELTALGSTELNENYASYSHSYSWDWEVVDANGDTVENAVVTLVEPVPEPATWLLITGGLLALAWRGLHGRNGSEVHR